MVVTDISHVILSAPPVRIPRLEHRSTLSLVMRGVLPCPSSLLPRENTKGTYQGCGRHQTA